MIDTSSSTCRKSKGSCCLLNKEREIRNRKELNGMVSDSSPPHKIGVGDGVNIDIDSLSGIKGNVIFDV